MTREQAINYLFSCGFTNEQVGEVVRALTYEPTTKNNLGVDCISRQGAIDAIRRIHPIDTDYDCTLFDKVDVMYVLNDIPSVTPQLSVSEVTALAEWTEKLTKASEDAYNKGYADGKKAQEPKTGHWIEKGKTDIAYDMCGYKSWATKYMCNHCGFIHTAIENHGVYSYCPNCGADMREVEE